MTGRDAVRLAKRLAATWPGANASAETIKVFAERLAAWDLEAGERAVEALIDGSRYFPSVYDLREAYVAAGGRLADPGRDMSPPVRPSRELPSQARAEVASIRRRIRARLRGMFDAEPNGGVESEQTTSEEDQT